MKNISKTKSAIHRKFRKLTVEQRIQALLDAGHISEQDAHTWRLGQQQLNIDTADRMIENVVGVVGLPQGVAINFPVNGKLYAVPMVVEEPSVVAALSYAGLLAEKTGGFQASLSSTQLYGQIQLIDIADTDSALQHLRQQKDIIIAAANAVIPKMVKRGGGVRGIDVYALTGAVSHARMVIVNVAIDTQDAMGANAVNTVCEALAPTLEAISGGQALLKILSNLADQAIASAEVHFNCAQLATKHHSGEDVRDRIILANDFACADPYRATTHNKGIMNGIDPVALATGNDWRSIEAAAHAYAARSGQYRALTEWFVGDDGQLCGRIELPMKVGTVGASLQTNPMVAMNQRLLGITSARELAELMAAVGLAQNFAALRALVTSGIQQGHMMLHARSVALSASVPEHLFDKVVAQLLDEGEIKVWRAKELVASMINEA